MSDRAYEDLGGEARRILEICRRQARRPYVLEITGTPKAGKTSAIAMLESFFRTCGWRVHVGRERAALCPLPMKGHFFFNTWTLCTMLSEVLDVADHRLPPRLSISFARPLAVGKRLRGRTEARRGRR